MVSLTTEDTFVIEGRGTVHTLTLPDDLCAADIRDYVILLDGKPVRVKQIELHAVMGAETRKGAPVGLLVDQLRQVEP